MDEVVRTEIRSVTPAQPDLWQIEAVSGDDGGWTSMHQVVAFAAVQHTKGEESWPDVVLLDPSDLLEDISEILCNPRPMDDGPRTRQIVLGRQQAQEATREWASIIATSAHLRTGRKFTLVRDGSGWNVELAEESSSPEGNPSPRPQEGAHA